MPSTYLYIPCPDPESVYHCWANTSTVFKRTVETYSTFSTYTYIRNKFGINRYEYLPRAGIEPRIASVRCYDIYDAYNTCMTMFERFKDNLIKLDPRYKNTTELKLYNYK